MVQLVWVGDRWASIGGLLLVAACAGETVTASTSSGGSGTTAGGGGSGTGGEGRPGGTRAGGSEACVTGDERCACYPNDTCNDDLTCASDLCVRLAGTGGLASTGGRAGSPGGEATGGAARDTGGTGGRPPGGGGGTTVDGGGGSTADTGGQTGTGAVQPGTSGAGGAGGADGARNPVTSVPGDTVLGTMLEDEAAQLCADIWAYYARTISTETICRYVALSDGLSSSAHDDQQLKSHCAATETSCLADPDTAWPPVDLELYCGSIPESCSATVAAYTPCIEDVAANFNAQVPELPSCAEITLELSGEVWDLRTADRPPSCTASCSIWPPDPREL
jgi:hypothetical protein